MKLLLFHRFPFFPLRYKEIPPLRPSHHQFLPPPQCLQVLIT